MPEDEYGRCAALDRFWCVLAHAVREESGRIAVTRICDRFGKTTVAYYKNRKALERLVNREDFLLLLARRERMVNPMAGCEKVLYAIRPAMAGEGVSMGVNRFYRLMKKNGLMVPKRKKYSCTTTRQGSAFGEVMTMDRGQKTEAGIWDYWREGYFGQRNGLGLG